MLVLSNQNVKNQILLSMQYGITHITLTRQGVGSGQALTPPLSQTHHQFCAEDVAGPWKADFVWCYDLPDVLRSIVAAGSPYTAPLCMHSFCQQSDHEFKATNQHI